MSDPPSKPPGESKPHRPVAATRPRETPARRHGWACQCGRILARGAIRKRTLACPYCGSTYARSKAGLKPLQLAKPPGD